MGRKNREKKYTRKKTQQINQTNEYRINSKAGNLKITRNKTSTPLPEIERILIVRSRNSVRLLYHLKIYAFGLLLVVLCTLRWTFPEQIFFVLFIVVTHFHPFSHTYIQHFIQFATFFLVFCTLFLNRFGLFTLLL